MTNGNQNTNPQAYFAGKYVDAMREFFAVSLTTGNNSVVIGAPGWGKTDIAVAMLDEIMPNDHYVLRIQPATSREEVQGSKDMEKLLKESVIVDKVDGTAYDPKWRAIVLDEVGRANRIIVGNLMFLLDRKDVRVPAPILATSNFMPTNPEAEAMLDRFGLWHWVKPSLSDFASVAKAQMQKMGNGGGANGGMKVPGRIPTLAELDFCHNAKPGPNAIKAISDVVEMVGNKATECGVQVTPRRITQWTHLLYRYGAYITGTEDFSSVPGEVVQALRFANISKTEQAYADWSMLIGSMVDPIAANIEAIMTDAVDAFQKFVSAGTSGLTDAATALMQAQAKLKAMGNDPRLLEAQNQLTAWFSAASRGEAVSR